MIIQDRFPHSSFPPSLSQITRPTRPPMRKIKTKNQLQTKSERVYIQIDDLVFFLGPGPGARSWCFMISVKRVERIKKGIKRQKGGREKGTFRGICMSPLNVLIVWVSILDLCWTQGRQLHHHCHHWIILTIMHHVLSVEIYRDIPRSRRFVGCQLLLSVMLYPVVSCPLRFVPHTFQSYGGYVYESIKP